MTAHHLRDLLEAAGIERLLAWSREPGLLPRVPRGPARGRRWIDLDDASLRREAADRDEDVRFTARAELARRSGEQPTTPTQATLL